MAFKNPFQHVENDDYEIMMDVKMNPSKRDRILARLDMIRQIQAARKSRRFDPKDKILSSDEVLAMRVRGLSSWKHYKAGQRALERTAILEEEEEYRLSLDPKNFRLEPLQPEDQWNLVTEKFSMIDSTAQARNSMTEFTPMDNLDSSVPKPLTPNLKLVDMIMTSPEKNGGFLTAKPGSGKTTVFTTLYPRMAAELALNWKHLWWVDENGNQRREPFTAEWARYRPIETRFLFMAGASLAAYTKGVVGESKAAVEALKEILRTNPDRIVLTIDEIYDALVGSQTEGNSASQHEIEGCRANFRKILKDSMGGQATKDQGYRYKLFCLFATENIDNWNKMAPQFMDQQVLERIGEPIPMKELSWDHTQADHWLGRVFEYFSAGQYRPPDLGQFTPEEQEKIKKNFDEAIYYIVEKTKRLYLDKNKTIDNVKQPSPQRSLNSSVTAMFSEYVKRVTKQDSSYDLYEEITQKLEDNNIQQMKIQKEIGLLESELRAEGIQFSAALSGMIRTAIAPTDDEEDEPGFFTLSPRETTINQGDQGQQGDQNQQGQQDNQENKDQQDERVVRLATLRELLAQKQAKKENLLSKRGLAAARISSSLQKNKIDDVLGPIGGDYVTPDCSNYKFFMKSDIVATSGERIRMQMKADEEKDLADKAKAKKKLQKTNLMTDIEYKEGTE